MNEKNHLYSQAYNGYYKGGIYTVNIPRGMNAWDVLEMLSWGMEFEDIANEILRKAWENEQGCPQAMRND